jgi:hypothetical protein
MKQSTGILWFSEAIPEGCGKAVLIVLVIKRLKIPNILFFEITSVKIIDICCTELVWGRRGQLAGHSCLATTETAD